MRVGVYLDGFNIYYGGRKQFGAGVSGWKWYSPRLLAENTLQEALAHFSQDPSSPIPSIWAQASIDRVVFCSARIAPDRSQKSADEQNLYLQAIQDGNHLDHLELGRYVARLKSAPLAVAAQASKAPQVVRSGPPVKILDSFGEKVDEGIFLVSYFHSEEKGSDVNLATHLISDALAGKVDAAIVISNDTDLQLPLELAGRHIPIGLVSPFYKNVAGGLRQVTGSSQEHWHYYLSKPIFLKSQMPDRVTKKVPATQPYIEKPRDW